MNERQMDDVRKLVLSWGSAVSLGTSDREGRVDVAPVGSTFFPSPGTIAVLRGRLARTHANLRERPEAVFLVSDISLLRWLRFFLTGKFGASFGYRVHVRLKEERELSERERDGILERRFGRLARSKGGRRVASRLRQVLLFEILEVREVVPFGGEGSPAR